PPPTPTLFPYTTLFRSYTQNGAYFLTICSQNRISYFGHIHEQIMHLNPAGQMIQHSWNRISERFPTIDSDMSVVMPNHIHGILRSEEHTSELQSRENLV